MNEVADNIFKELFHITKKHRAAQKAQKPCVVWLTGLSGAGKSTIAKELDSKLYKLGVHSYILDGDNLRLGINKGLGFSVEERSENIRRTAEITKLFVDAGLVVIVAVISPFSKDREMARTLFEGNEFIEVFVDAPLAIVEQRDTKGLYKKARSGEFKNFTGVSSPYEVPRQPEIYVPTNILSCSEATNKILNYIIEKDFIS
ncbi:adenylyl-sulfate kinase [Acinetobacter baumannii]|nr:adenylyl-sulfate kinase [Acinetobacter baumannii]